MTHSDQNTNSLRHFVEKDTDPIHFVPLKRSADSLLSKELCDVISIDVIHDGVFIPPTYLETYEGERFNREDIQRRFTLERDWGANLVAEDISRNLGLSGFTTVRTARCLLDFGRFPGSTRDGASHLGRFAINTPFAQELDYDQKRSLLENHYDVISDKMEEQLRGKLLKIAIHTYDPFNESGTERPHVSLVTRTIGYQLESRMPFGVFDPLYPDILAEFTVDRVLRDRISLTLEKNRIPVAHNYPYLLPEGSTEVRHLVWRFFSWLQQKFERRYPETIGDPAYSRVWEMLQDTNLRSAQAGELRSVLHMHRRPPTETTGLYEYIIDAYRNIHFFVSQDNKRIVNEYRNSSERCMSLGIEIRKDLVWRFDKDGVPIEPKPDFALKVSKKIAEAISIYMQEDRGFRSEIFSAQ